jgi:hypothetical protein
MSPRVPDTHAEAWNLLPWLANGRIAVTDREWVEAHVQSCGECRAEFAAQRRIAQELRAAGEAPAAAPADEQRSFDKLWSRIEASDAAAAAGQGIGQQPLGRPRSTRTVRWLAAAVIVQGIGLALFGVQALRSDNGAAPQIRTVAREAAPRGDAPLVSLVFASGASIETINTLLTHQGLSIVAGPGLSGNFTAALSADAVAAGASAESVAAVMSKDPNVTFAQPVAR